MTSPSETLFRTEIAGRLIACARHDAGSEVTVIFSHGFRGEKTGPNRAFVRAARPFLTPTELARATMLTTGGRLRRLEGAGLIERAHDPADGRSLSITLTETGRETIERAARAGVELQEQALAGLSETERQRLDGALRALMGAAALREFQPN